MMAASRCARDPVLLTIDGSVAEFMATSQRESPRLIEADLLAPLYSGVQDLFASKQFAIDPASVAQRGGHIGLTRIGGELAQDPDWRNLTGACDGHGPFRAIITT